MVVLLMRVALAPLLLALSALAAWRWGAWVGGWLLGLPLVSGSVSVLLMLQHGSRFAAVAARGALLGLLASAVFCVCYALSSRRLPWWLSLVLSAGACLISAWLVSLVSVPVPVAASLAVLMVVVSSFVLGVAEPCERSPKPGAGALAARMIVAGLVVATITGSAGLLGPTASGLLSPLPVMLSVMVAHAHRREGHDTAESLLHGALAGSIGGVAFFAAAGAMLGVATPVVAYATALVAGLAGGGAALWLQHSGFASKAASRVAHRTRRPVKIAPRIAPPQLYTRRAAVTFLR